MAGYDGYSKSNNALEAEAEGRFPLSHIAKMTLPSGWTKAAAKRAAKANKWTSTEWHHTSSKFNKTDYYDPQDLNDLNPDDFKPCKKVAEEDVKRCETTHIVKIPHYSPRGAFLDTDNSWKDCFGNILCAKGDEISAIRKESL